MIINVIPNHLSIKNINFSNNDLIVKQLAKLNPMSHYINYNSFEPTTLRVLVGCSNH